ncbi:hypothetical protein NKH24_09885 [Mesorhizobium sp. M1300]|uniref:hypothetical protein n=1 Tax=Mesorhizobium sp. M1300 TaxID=2957077 RepID=UPI0033357AF8
MNQDIGSYFNRFSVPAEVISFVCRPIGHFIDGKEVDSAADFIDVIEPFTRQRLTGLASGSVENCRSRSAFVPQGPHRSLGQNAGAGTTEAYPAIG